MKEWRGAVIGLGVPGELLFDSMVVFLLCGEQCHWYGTHSRMARGAEAERERVSSYHPLTHSEVVQYICCTVWYGSRYELLVLAPTPTIFASIQKVLFTLSRQRIETS